MKSVIILFFTFISSASFASIAMNSVELGAGYRFERETDGVSVDGQGTVALAVDIVVDPVDFLFEFSTFKNSESESLLEVDRRHYELMSWLRYKILNRERFDLYLGVGAGFFWENITTIFLGQSDEVSTSTQWVGGATGAMDYKVSVNWALGLDLRLVGNTNNELEPVFDTSVRLKYLF